MGEREGASVVIDQLFAAPTAAPLFDLSADLLPLTVELHDVLQLHARRAGRLDRRLEDRHQSCLLEMETPHKDLSGSAG